MKTSSLGYLDFVIDKLTKSIENIATGEVFDTVIIKFTNKEVNQIKKGDWQFDWKKEIRDQTKEVYKLTTINNPTIIQGLLSIEDKQDHIFMHLIEARNLISTRIKFILEFPETSLLMLVKFLLTKVTKASWRLMPSLL